MDPHRNNLDGYVAWFGSSTAVDADGAPLVLFHGTDADFGGFERTRDIGFHFGSAVQAANRGITAGRDHLKRELGAWRVLPVTLRIVNPLVLVEDPRNWAWRDLAAVLSDHALLPEAERAVIEAEAAAGERQALERVEAAIPGFHAKTGRTLSANVIEAAREIALTKPNGVALGRLRAAMEARGIDGIVYPNNFEDRTLAFTDRAAWSWCAFHGAQVRSVFASDGWHPARGTAGLRAAGYVPRRGPLDDLLGELWEIAATTAPAPAPAAGPPPR